MSTSTTSRIHRLLALCAVLPLLLLAACGGGGDAFDTGAGDTASTGSGNGAEVVIAGQAYSEMKIMTAMYAALLEDAGYKTTIKSVDRAVYAPELESGAVDVSADYAASMTEYLNVEENGPDAKQLASHDVGETIAALTALGKDRGIVPLEPAKAQDANAFMVTKEISEKFGITRLSDLKKLDQPLTLAAAPECPEREDCKLGLERVYGITISKVEPLGFGTVQTKDAVKNGEVDFGQVGTSDATVDQLGLVVLEDDKALENAENLTPVVNIEFLEAHKDVADILNELSATLTTDDLQDLIGQVDTERALPEDVAKQYLQDKGLL